LAKEKLNSNEVTNEYDPDNEIFKFIFTGYKPIYVKVPIDEAKSLDNNFNKIKYKNLQFTLVDNEFQIIHLEIFNPQNSKSYKFDSDETVSFSSTQLALNFEDIDIKIPESKEVVNKPNEAVNTVRIGKSDVDLNIPKTKEIKTNTYALIIGNEDYTKYQSDLGSESDVQFANSDAKVFAKYVEQTLGVPKDNIVLLTDAISSVMKREVEKLSKLAKYSKGKAELLFYYAGHGFPDEKTKESYIMPVDISGAYVSDGIKLDDLYSKLTEYPVCRVTVFIDACFSGGGRNSGLLATRGVKIVPKSTEVNGNMVVFTASTGQQSSLPYNKKQHGMFTYFLLKKLQETNGDVTYSVLSDYLLNQVQLNAIKVNSKDQNPQTLISTKVKGSWENWKIK
ncbi:MAG: caspase family protein, partial [Bacteroidales bacterium]|nr:caspase family protein [Bacteroidales bacterium]